MANLIRISGTMQPTPCRWSRTSHPARSAWPDQPILQCLCGQYGESYLAQLAEAGHMVRASSDAAGNARRKLVFSRHVWLFCSGCGFEIIGTAEVSLTEAADPSARELAALAETIRAAASPPFASVANLIDRANQQRRSRRERWACRFTVHWAKRATTVIPISK
ncbi:MAG: hypothetical protein R2911_25475 [Caldilineaceae bacterium]